MGVEVTPSKRDLARISRGLRRADGEECHVVRYGLSVEEHAFWIALAGLRRRGVIDPSLADVTLTETAGGNA